MHSEEAKKRIGDAARKRNSAAIALKARWANRQTTCKIDGCDKPHDSRGYCNMHYLRWRKNGDAGEAKPMINKKGEGNHINFYGYHIIGKKGAHISIAEKSLGRKLPKNAVVHHIDEDKTNNQPSNLVLCQDRAYHNLIHARMRALDACGNAEWLKCPFCGNYDDPKNLYVYPNKRAGKHTGCFNKYRAARRVEDNEAAMPILMC